MHTLTTKTLALKWEKPFRPTGPDSDPTATLHGHISIAGVLHHIEAWAVIYEDGEQQAVTPDTCNYAELSEIVQAAGETITIDGRDYVCMVSPFQK